MSDPINCRKAEIRQKVRQLRRSVTNVQAQQAAIAIGTHITKLTFYQQSRNIACFLSFDGEIDTQFILKQLLQDKSRCFLPKLRPIKPNRLWFMPYRSESKLIKNRFGIAEPDLAVNHAMAVSQLDVILMPLVAFDEQGNRLGMGGGFYDATLSHLKRGVGAKSNPKCIGVAYEIQKISDLPVQDWDFPLDGVITEKQFYNFGAQ